MDVGFDEVDDIGRAQRLPSPQLVGSPERVTVDLNSLAALGVELVGRLAGLTDGKVAVLRIASPTPAPWRT